MNFKEDFQSFVDLLSSNKDPAEIKKEYRKLVKKYHPDFASDKDKSTFNEYIQLINQAYICGRTQTKETVIEENCGNPDRTYVFTRVGSDGKQYSYKCRNYYDYLYKVARNEFNTGHEILHFHSLNHIDRKALDQNSLEVLQHYRNAIKCLKFILKNCTDPVIISSCEFDISMVQDAINKLSRTLAESDEKGLALRG